MDEVQVVEKECQFCGEKNSLLLNLSNCNHYVHYSCCSPKNTSPRTSKKAKTLNKCNNNTVYACPICNTDITWLDHCLGIKDHKRYLQYACSVYLMNVSSAEANLKEALGSFVTSWKKQAASKANIRGKGRRPSSKAHPRGAVSRSWATGTGFGGTSGEASLSSSARDKIAHLQYNNDVALLKSIEMITLRVKELKSPDLTTTINYNPIGEIIFRIQDYNFLSVVNSFLVNGPTDVVSRKDLYLELFALLLEIAKLPSFVPILISNQTISQNMLSQGKEEEEDEETKQDTQKAEEEDLSSSLLMQLCKLLQGLEPLSKNETHAKTLLDVGEQVRENALKSISKHPHFLKSISVIRERINGGSNAHLRQMKVEALKLVTSSSSSSSSSSSFSKQQDDANLVKMYKNTLAPFQFRSICLVDLCVSGHAAHSFIKVDPITRLPYVSFSSTDSKKHSHSTLLKNRLSHIAKEIATIKSSLPLEWNSSIFCVVDETRPDVLQFLIIGPEGTPYQNGCFIFDVYLSNTFPNDPPCVMIQTTGGGRVRFNPNLYRDGKVCLSLLNTWSGPGWDPATSTLLQVLISIQSLIMVPEPYFNEPGLEESMGTSSGKFVSGIYNATIRSNTIKVAMLENIMNPPYAFQQIIRTHFLLKQKEILNQLDAWTKDLEAQLAAVARSTSSSYGSSSTLQLAVGQATQMPNLEPFKLDCTLLKASLLNLTTTSSTKVAPTVTNTVSLLEEEENEEIDDEEDGEEIEEIFEEIEEEEQQNNGEVILLE